MRYLSTYYWQQEGENTSSLVLLQAYHKKNGIPVLLACVCEQELIDRGSGLADKLTEWFYDRGLPLCGRNGERGWRKATKSLEKLLKQSLHFTGIFCAGNHFLHFDRDGGKVFLLNVRNGKPHCQELCGGMYCDRYGSRSGTLFLEQGMMQDGIGILLTTKAFGRNLSEAIIGQHLDVREMCREKVSEEYTEKYMRDCLAKLRAAGKCEDCKSVAAVLFYSRKIT